MTKLTVIVDKTPEADIDLYNDLIRRVDIWRKATEGVGRFRCRVKNESGEYIGAFEADDPVEIHLESSNVVLLRGYLDSAVPVSTGDKTVYLQELELTGRDYGQDLMNKMVDKSLAYFPYTNQKADDIIDDMLLRAGSEIVFESPHIAPVISYGYTGAEYLIEAIRKIMELEKVSHDCYVDENGTFHMFPIGSIDSGIILATGTNILKLEKIEFDAYEIRNYIIAKGKNVNDGWTEGNADDFTCATNNTLTNNHTYAMKNYYSVKCSKGAGTRCEIRLAASQYNYDSPNYLPFHKIGAQEISLWARVETDALYDSQWFFVELTDSNDHVIRYISHAPGHAMLKDKWYQITVPVGLVVDPAIVDYSEGATGNLKRWTHMTAGNAFDWKVKGICVRDLDYTNDKVTAIYLDGLVVPVPMIAYAQDGGEGSSQEKYKVRQAFVNGRDCLTQLELQDLANATLAASKNPLAPLKVFALGTAGIIEGANKWIPGYKVRVHSPQDGISNTDYRIAEVHLIISDEPVMMGQDFIAEVDLVPYSQEVQTRRLAFRKEPSIALTRALNDALRVVERLEEPRFDWWPARPVPLSKDEADWAVFTESDHADVSHVGYGTVLEGTFAERPAYGVAGRIYHATDTDAWYLDTGSEWINITVEANLDVPAGPPDAPTGLSATGLPLEILVKWTANTEADLDRYVIYRSTSTAPTNEYARVDTNYFVDTNVTVGTTYYYRVKAIDRVGNLSGYSNEDSAVATEAYTPTDPDPPSFDANDITIETVVDNDGVTKTYFVITFARVADAYGYILSFKKTGTTDYIHLYAEQVASGNVVIKTGFVELDTRYYFKACSLNEFNEASSWSSEVYKDSGIDEDAPGQPTGLVTTNMKNGILLSWNRCTAKDFSHYGIYVSDTTTPPDSPNIFTKSSVYKYETVDYGTTKYFWISAFDITGNESVKSSRDDGTALKILHGDIGPSAVEATEIMNGAIEEAKLADKAVTNAKIAVDAIHGDVIKASAITVTKIADDAIETPKLKAGAVVAGKIATGAVTAEKIQSGAVETDKLDAGAVTAQKFTVYSVFCDNPNFRYKSLNRIEWDAFDLQYEGVIKSIAAGYTAEGNDYTYLYWDKGDSTLSYSSTKPDWIADRFLLAYRYGTTIYELWNATFIHGGQVITDTVTAKEIASKTITSEQIHAGAITADEIDSDAVTAAKIKAGEVDTDHLAVGAITAEKIDTDAVEADKIKAGAVTAKKIALERTANQTAENELNPSAGNLWWRTDKDQIRFKSDVGIEKLAKVPLYYVPPESPVPNGHFEEQGAAQWVCPHGTYDSAECWDAAGWDYTEGEPYVRWTDIQAHKSGHSVLMLLGASKAGWYGIALSPKYYIPVKENTKYLFRVAARGAAAMTSALSVLIIFYQKDGVTVINYQFPFPNQNVTTSWQEFSGEVTSPAGACFARIFIGINTPSDNYALYVDDVVFSEQKAAVPTAGVVAAKLSTLQGAGKGTTQNTWSTDIKQITVPNIDHEMLLVQISFAWDYSHYFKYRIYNITKAEYYPSDDHTKCPYLMCGDQDEISYISGIMTIPKNVKGDTLRLDVYRTTVNKARNFVFAAISCWGHSMHSHR